LDERIGNVAKVIWRLERTPRQPLHELLYLLVPGKPLPVILRAAISQKNVTPSLAEFEDYSCMLYRAKFLPVKNPKARFECNQRLGQGTNNIFHIDALLIGTTLAGFSVVSSCAMRLEWTGLTWL
jgi:hypothetical protein